MALPSQSEPIDAASPAAAPQSRAELVVRLILSAAAGAAVILFDLRAVPLLFAAIALAALRPRAATLLWIALTGTLFLPLFQLRSASVYFGTAYLALLGTQAGCEWLLQRRAWRPPVALTGALLTMALVAVICGINGALTYDPTVPGVHRFALAQAYAAALIVIPAAAALLVAYRCDDIRPVIALVVAVGAWCAVVPIVVAPAIPAFNWGRMISINAMALMYALLLHRLPRSFWLRGLGTAFVLFALTVSLLIPLLAHGRGQWVSAWINALVGLGVITWLWLPNKVRWPAALAGIAVIGVAGWPYIQRAVERAHEEGDFGRLRIWKDALRLVAMRPLLGVGPGNYSDYIERYSTYHPYGSAHGNYQQILAETGLLGMGVVLWVLLAAAALAWKLRQSADPLTAAFALGFLGVLSGQAAASVVGDYVIPAYHNAGHTTICVTLYLWILLGTLMAAATQRGGSAASSSTR